MKDEDDFSKATQPIGQISWKSWRELDTERENLQDCRYKFLAQGKFSEKKRLVNAGNVDRFWRSQ